MDNNQNKFSNVDDYDLILEEKEKELKKEKRNKRILASSLLLLLLLGSTAVVAPIISVAVNNKNNSANINNIKIPSKLTFTNSDITTLIDGYKSEIKARKLTFNEFQTDFTNITKKYIVASNLPIGTIVKSTKITQNATTNDFNIEIVLDENKEYSTSEELTPATLNKNTLTISFKENEKLLGDFFTPIEIDKTRLDNLKEQIQNWIKNNQFTKEEFENSINNGSLKDKIKDWLGINKDLIGDIRYEEPKLIIEPKEPYTFDTNGNNDLIVNGNIEISNIKFYKVIKFINLGNLFNKLNEVIQSTPKGDKTTAEYFKKYLTTNPIDDIVYNNLEFENQLNFNRNDILNIELNDNEELVINLQSYEYLKYEIENNSNFKINNNKLIISNLNFYIDGVVFFGSDFKLIDAKVKLDNSSTSTNIKCIYSIISNKNRKKIILPERIYDDQPLDLLLDTTFRFNHGNDVYISQPNDVTEYVDMSALTKWAGLTYYYKFPPNCSISAEANTLPNHIFEIFFVLKKVILPKNTKIIGISSFKKCYKLKTINLPSSLNEIRSNAFESSGLESLVIPASVTTLGELIFSGCNNLKWVKISSKITNIDQTSFDTKSSRGIIIYVPTQELKTYYDGLNLNGVKEVIVGEPPAN